MIRACKTTRQRLGPGVWSRDRSGAAVLAHAAPAVYDSPRVLAAILTIGDELCRGEIVDTNATRLAAELWDLEVTVAWITTCRDDPADIRHAVTDAASRVDLVITSGGLGPTEDDLTVDVVADLLGVEAVVHEPSRVRMDERFAALGFAATANNLRQVRVPAGARVYDNPVGMAPGFEATVADTPVVCLPGVPRELFALFSDHVGPRVAALRAASGVAPRIVRRLYRCFGKGESHVATALAGLLDGDDGLGASLHYNVSFPEVLVKLVVRDPDPAAAERRLAALSAELERRLTGVIYGQGDTSQAAVLGAALTERGLTLATAESCTGGLVGGLITAVPGSSRYYLGGAVTYSNREKVRQLGVDEAILAGDGAVSEACVVAMARGARERLGSDLAVAVSGVAGPDGGTAEKPVGTVWLAVAGPDDAVASKRLNWPGSRDQIRILSAHWAMALCRRALAEAR
jgi:nicotinamide-nucleotide amidase